MTIRGLSCLILLGAGSVVSAAGISTSTAKFLKTHCFDCHTGSAAEASLDISALPSELTGDSFEDWVRVFDRVENGEMPPADSERPKATELKKFLHDTSQQLKSHQQIEYETLGRVRARRLTNLQLERTLQDLLGIDIPLASHMPDEPRTHGYNTVAEGQSISHFQLQTHLAVVDTALDEAFRRATSKIDEWKKDLLPKDIARRDPDRRCREPEMLDGAAVVWHTSTTFYGRLPVTTARVDGWYRMKLDVSGLNVPEKHGVWSTVRVGQCVSSAPLFTWGGGFEASKKRRSWTFEAWLPKGHMFEVRPSDRTLKLARFEGGQVGSGEGTPQKVVGIAIHGMELERIHKGPNNATIRKQLFGELKVDWNKKTRKLRLLSDEPRKDGARLIRQFANRAFRRPIDEDTIAPYVALVTENLNRKVPLLQAVRAGYRAILCSPRFLHLQEEPGELDDFALAARLSYLLWNTMPDGKLTWAAKSGELRKPEVLKRQVGRMLKDPRGRRFVKDFAHQWLDLSEIDFTEPDRRLYGEFDVVVQESMLNETHAFLQEMLDRNLSVSNLIDSNFTFLNSRLARYYDIANVSGDFLRKVQLRDEHKRGGLLTQGAILKVTANGTTTSPVLRGVWVSERLLGEEIPPPPDSVPAIEPDIRGATTIREMLEKHKSDSACASCHLKIDPPGFALENFDPAGQWRDRYPAKVKGRKARGLEVDPSYEFMDGKQFRTVEEFQKLVLRDKAPLAANVARQLLTYGTGARCGFADRDAIDAIVKSTESKNYGFRSILEAVVASDTFRTK